MMIITLPMLRKFCILLFIATLAYAAPAMAQTPNGSVHGTVADPTGAMIPFATIVLSNESGVVKTVTASSDGTFAIDHVIPGRYSLIVTASGFAPATIPGVEVFTGKATVNLVKLRLPVEQQQVQVSDEGLSVNTGAD